MMRQRPQIADILIQRSSGFPVVIAAVARPVDATLIVRKLPPEPPPIPKRKAPQTFGPARPQRHVVPWLLALIIVLGAGVRPQSIDPMTTWHRAASELQLTERAHELLRELR